MSSTQRHDVVIAGGGTAGLALACALADALGDGGRIAVADRAQLGDADPGDARAFALSAGSKRMLAMLGVWPQIAEHAQPVTAIDITDSSLQDAFRPVLVSYDNTVEGGEPATYIVTGACTSSLVAAAKETAIAPGGAAAATLLRTSIKSPSICRSRPLRAALLVAADGGKSQLAAGIGSCAGLSANRHHHRSPAREAHQGRAVRHCPGPFAILH
jgi:2-octaprenyl-6-methoxyphenol hydroxylase